MKFMKLGTRPDTFISLDDSTRSVISEIPTDITVEVDTTRFLLHKFPLLSKCSYLKKLHGHSPSSSSSSSSTSPLVLTLRGFPGGAAAFELCAKFCYGVTITVSASNVVAAMSAAAHLQMIDDQERGNLLGKLDSFLTACLLRRWKDALTTLRSTAELPTSSDRLGIAPRSAAALAGMIAGDPTREQSTTTNIPWWVEDLGELSIQHFSAIMAAVKSSGKVPGNLVAESLQVYLRQRRPPTKEVVEKVVGLLPEERGSVRCGFLLRLLKVASFVGLEGELRGELVRRAAGELERAETAREVVGDVGTVVEVVGEFMSRNGKNGNEMVEEEGIEKVVKVGRLVDGWLKERAGEMGMSVEKVVEIAGMVPEWARRDHDDLYRAIDLYLKAHPDLDKIDRKRLCRVLDCKKLSVESSVHAAQNERLPLRVVVQVLFFATSSNQVAELPPNIKAILSSVVPSRNCDSITTPKPVKFGLENGGLDDRWSGAVSGIKCLKPNVATLQMKLTEEIDDGDKGEGLPQKNGLLRSSSTRFKVQERPKRMLSRLWSTNRSTVIGERR